jgi:hypothetical protein
LALFALWGRFVRPNQNDQKAILTVFSRQNAIWTVLCVYFTYFDNFRALRMISWLDTSFHTLFGQFWASLWYISKLLTLFNGFFWAR